MSSIRQRPDGAWRARYRDDDGREHARHFERKRDGQAWLEEVASSRLTGTYVAPAAQRSTLAEFYADWVGQQLWAEGTRRAADRALAGCSFASIPFGKLRRSHGEAYVKALASSLAPSTVKTRVAYVRIVLRAAMLDRRLAQDPLEGVKLPAIRKTEHSMRVPTGAEVRAIREHLDPAHRALVDVMAYAGLRIGEAAGLQLKDVGFLPSRSIHVQRQVQNRVGRLDVVAPKHGSERVVPVPDELLLRLSRHVETIGVYGNEGWLFGSPPSPTALRHYFVNACRAAGVTGVTPHDLRHHYASGLIRAGLDPVAVAKAMGHSSPSITLEVYAHLWPDAADRTRVAAATLMSSSAASADQLRTAEA
ncbi:site-specific integrase [Curtobacterium sp. MCBA15_004]|uniref:tyrosine-type recombinase/integrase n=1 Tax=Curtobacterium sp. MCBA15_004 TaxID=1898733 RepID=UPI0008DDF49D|nr:site-specific integrase [Curtobacterium sp. MCBA15_004]WIA98042.1 site-specific integrase [Curtobacterium sp. MCBA15_004]